MAWHGGTTSCAGIEYGIGRNGQIARNTFRAVNIGLVNEVALMCDKLGLMCGSDRSGRDETVRLYEIHARPWFGRPLHPNRPHYLSWKLKTLNYTARFIELAAEVNGYMPEYVVGKVVDALNDARKAVNGSRADSGVAYKPNVSDVRESPAMDIIHLLQERGQKKRIAIRMYRIWCMKA